MNRGDIRRKWHDAIKLHDAWTRLMTGRLGERHRKAGDRGFEGRKMEANFLIAQYVSNGDFVAFGRKDAMKSNSYIYEISPQFFVDPRIIDFEKGEIEFDGECYVEIRIWFPPNFSDIDTWPADRLKANEPESESPRKIVSSTGKHPGGRPSYREPIMAMFEGIKASKGDEFFNNATPTEIYMAGKPLVEKNPSLKAEFGKGGKREYPNLKTIGNYLRKYRNGNI